MGNMKIIAVLALTAMAFAEPKAEADRALIYGAAYGYGYGYKTSGAYRTYGAYPYRGYYYGKRSAEADRADPDASYGYDYGYNGSGYGSNGYAYYGKRSADYEPEAPYPY